MGYPPRCACGGDVLLSPCVRGELEGGWTLALPHMYQAKGNFRLLCSKPVCTLWVGCALTGVSGGDPGSQTPSERRNWGGEFLA